MKLPKDIRKWVLKTHPEITLEELDIKNRYETPVVVIPQYFVNINGVLIELMPF